MNELYRLAVCMATFCLFASGTGALAQLNGVAGGISAAQQGRGQSAFITGGISSFGILTDEVQSRLGIVCEKRGSQVYIEQVRADSEAEDKDLLAGDCIVDVRADSGLFVITIERGGKLYQAKLSQRLGIAALHRETAAFDNTRQAPVSVGASQFQLQANGGHQVSSLANYELELIMDRSLSMRRRDCPGGYSRWDWSASQSVAMARALAPYTKHGLTITRFATDFDVHEHTQPDQAVDLLSRHEFQFGTRLCEALTARLDRHFANRKIGDKPLLIAVITDGCPFPRPEPRMVIDELVSASYKMMRSDEITVVFLQLGGDDPRGRNYLLNLGSNLVSYGARYQFVRTKSFEELETTGLASALVDSVSSVKTAYRER